MMDPKYSVIVPVYNRPDELRELLASLAQQTVKCFEVLVVDDGSSQRSDTVVDSFRDHLDIRYFFKPNSGPGPSRNFGFSQARGRYFVVFDSDCIIPPAYFEIVDFHIHKEALDAWGGPDKAHEDFTLLQRATGYTMASFLTTGGIRGGKKRVGWFQPRSFNMGLSRQVYESTSGFAFDRFAEDIELSIRMRNSGFRVELIADAFVYHKRRTTFGAFFRQVSNFGKGRAWVGKKHPVEVRVTHWFPTFFTAGIVLTLICAVPFPTLALAGTVVYGTYFTALLVHALVTTRSLAVAALSIPAAFLQLTGYGIGFVREMFRRA